MERLSNDLLATETRLSSIALFFVIVYYITNLLLQSQTKTLRICKRELAFPFWKYIYPLQISIKAAIKMFNIIITLQETNCLKSAIQV